MKDEIKEILDNTLEYLEGIDETRNTKILTTNETNILLDYITNLQEEYRQTKLLKERYQLEKEKYKSTIDKIKEYGENCLENLKDQDDYIDESINVVALLRMIHKNYLELLEEVE